MTSPEGWKRQRIGEFAAKVQDGTHFSPSSTDGPYRYLTSKNIRMGRLDLRDSGWISEAEHRGIYRRCDPRKGDVLLTKDGANTGNVVVNPLDEEFSLLSSVAMIRCDESRSSGRYLYHLLASSSGRQQMEAAMAGNAISRLTLKKIVALVVEVPPLEEQRRIAEILDTIDETIQATERVIAKLQSTRQAILRERANAPLGVAFDGHRVADLGAVTLGRQRSPSHMTGVYSTPYLRVANVYLDRIDYSDVLVMDFTPTEREKFYLEPGDILLNEGQSLELVGRSAVYTGERRRFCFQNTLLRFRANRDLLNPDYAQLMFEQWLKRGDFQKVAFRTTSIAHLGADRFARMAMTVPSLEEQRNRLETVRAVSARLVAENASLNGLRHTRSGLTADLLTGRVRTVAA